MTEAQGEGLVPAEGPALRASDDDRHNAASLLRDAAGRGVLDFEELEDRVGRVYASKTLPELARITADLPTQEPAQLDEPPAPKLTIPALQDPGFQSHLVPYVLVIGMLIGIWALSGGGHFWPFYPAAGWGIGLGSHFLAATQNVRRKEQQALEGDPASAELTAQSDGDELPRELLASDHESEPSVAPADTPSPPQQHAPVTPDETRREFVVAMFVDVVGSTELNEALGDESWSRVRDRFRALLNECFDEEGGWEVNVAGDGVLARFDNPAAAVRASVEIQRRLDRRRRETGFAPNVRIGIHSGDVMTEGDDLIGTVVNLASRVTSAAEPDEIFVTEHVADHLPGSIATSGRGLHTLRGVSRPRHLLAVDWH